MRLFNKVLSDPTFKKTWYAMLVGVKYEIFKIYFIKELIVVLSDIRCFL